MRLLRFELRKVRRQKRFLWPLLAIMLLTCGLLYYNGEHQDETKKHLQSKAESYSMEAGSIYKELREKDNEKGLSEEETKRMDIANQMATDIFQWKSTIQDENWQELPEQKQAFLVSLQDFDDAGGTFWALEGIAREEAIVKNSWLMEHDLAYEDDTYPLSPALITKETGDILLGVAGIVLLVLLFGTTLTEEKEQQTWLTLKTIPVSKSSQVLAKFGSILCIIILYSVFVLFSGWLFATLFGHGNWSYNYPHVYTDFFNGVHAISIQAYLLRLIGLFLCATVFAFALVFLLSTRMKHSFSMLISTGFILLIGYMITDIQPVLQTAWNPFQFFRMDALMSEAPVSADWLYGLSAVIWSMVLVAAAIILPEKEHAASNRSSVSKAFQSGETRQRKKVWEIVLFEWRKLKRLGLFKQFVMLLFLFIIVGYIVIYQQSEVKKQTYIDNLEQSIEHIDNNSIPWLQDDKIPTLQGELQEAEDAEDNFQKSQIKTQIGEWEKDLTLYLDTKESKQLSLQAIKDGDWQTLYQQQRFEAEINRGDHDSQFFLRGIQHLSDISGKASIEEKDWLMEYDIHPIFSGISVNTIYEDWGEDNEFLKDWKKGNKKVDPSGLFSLYHLFQYGIGYLLLFLLLFLVAMGFANERGKNPTIQFLQVQPLKRRSIFFGKYIHASIVALLSSLSIFLFVILLGTVFSRFGDWNYPILHYNSDTLVASDAYSGFEALEGGYNFMPLGTLLMQTIALFVCMVLCVIAMTHVLSFLKIHVLSVLATTVFISIGGYIGSLQLGEYAIFSPFTYFNVTKVTNGELATTLDQPAITVWNGCLVLLAFTVVLLVVGYALSGMRYKKKRVNEGTVEKTA